jgi:hypothetical protein
MNNQTQNQTVTPIWRSFYDSVQVVATTPQIDNATRNLTYSEIENPGNSSCPITLERFEGTSQVTQILYCGHIFSSTGLSSWLRTNVRCPVCRYDIREYRTRNQDLNTMYSSSSNNEETKIENDNEETKSNEETIPNSNSSTSNQERNSNSRVQTNIRPMNVNDELTNILSNVTEELLNGFLRPSSQQNGSLTSSLFDPSYNSFFYDSSNNQIVFEGFMRR